ncbi:MAG: NUDIX domain-containing protein [Xanthobacteraceae bacterium]
MTVKITNVDPKYTGWARFLVVSVRLPSGQMVRREIEDHGAAVAVLAYDPERKTAILVEQFRAPVFFCRQQETTLEAIAGIQEEVDAAAAARREALEEAGLRLNTLEHVATTWTMPGISTEQMTLYLATYEPADRIKEGGGVATEHENTSIVEIELAKLGELMQAGQLTDMKTLVLVQALKLRHPDLFA